MALGSHNMHTALGRPFDLLWTPPSIVRIVSIALHPRTILQTLKLQRSTKG